MRTRVVTSAFDYDETLRLLTLAIEGGGSRIFATIDQRAAAASVGLELRPTCLIVFGNPTVGTALMEASPLIGLDLPLKLLVWAEDEVVRVAYVAMPVLTEDLEIAEQRSRIEALDRTLKKLAETVALPDP